MSWPRRPGLPSNRGQRNVAFGLAIRAVWAASNGANRNPKRGTSVSLERQAIGQLIQKTETKAPSLFAVNYRVRGQMSLRIVAAEDTSRRPSTSACGTKQTFAFVALKSAFNPKQTFASRGEADAATGVHLHQATGTDAADVSLQTRQNVRLQVGSRSRKTRWQR